LKTIKVIFPFAFPLFGNYVCVPYGCVGGCMMRLLALSWAWRGGVPSPIHFQTHYAHWNRFFGGRSTNVM